MKSVLSICLLMLAVPGIGAGVEAGAFEPAQQVPKAGPPSFFVFSTSFGKYTIRHDGMGELALNGKRRSFYLKQKIRLVGRLEQVYFREHERDLLLLYQVTGGTVYLARMVQKSKKIRWLALVNGNDLGPCVVAGDEAQCGANGEVIKIDLKTGDRLDSD